MASNKHEQNLFEQILAKFIINLPLQELEDSNRLSYQSEKAFYYYLDSVINNSAPDNWEKLRNQFLAKLAQYSPSSLRIDPRKIIMKLQENKPVCGALIFNKDESKILVVRTRNKFGFPKGKWNQHQTARQCAAREVQEETGIYIHNRMEPNIQLEFESHGNSTTFFVAKGVSEDERLRMDLKEIDQIFWMRVEDIEPNWKKFAEKSRMAWELYLKITKRSQTDLKDFQNFMEMYKGENTYCYIAENPFLTFRFDREALKNALLTGL